MFEKNSITCIVFEISFSSKLVENVSFVIIIFNEVINVFLINWIIWVRHEMISTFLFQIISWNWLSISFNSVHIVSLLSTLSVITVRKWIFSLYFIKTFSTISANFWSIWESDMSSNSKNFFWYCQFWSI